METLGRYQLTTALSNQNAGSCQWCFARLNGREYFIKEFLEPKYPANDTTSSPEKLAKKEKKCKAFEAKKANIYRAINDCSDGNAVRITDFFRVGAKYYMVMPRIRPVKMEIAGIANLSPEVKRRLCAVIAHSVAQLHSVNFVHGDIKHTNIMFTHTHRNHLTAKVIDYDAGYFVSSPPMCVEELAGDQVYFSPEAWSFMLGQEAQLTCKLDVFALGILFHQYWTGSLPQYDMQAYISVGDAVQQGAPVEVSWDMPADLHRLLVKMLDVDPAKRPSAKDVYNTFIPPLKPDSFGDKPATGGFKSLGNL